MPITNPTLSNRWQIEFFGGMQRRPRLARAFPIPGDPALQMTAPWPLDPSSANLPQPSSVRILRMVRRCFAPTAIDEFPRADYHFYTMGLPYYVAGRFGALHWLSPVAGTLLHHAVEMLLKGRLAHCYSLKDLKDSNKFGHNLGKCWTGFKAIFSTEDLSPFDHVVTKLNEFEKLRYPDDLLKFGAHISIGFRTGTLMSSHTPPPVEPIYELSVTDLDAFMDRLFKLCGINPEAYLQPYNNAVEFVERHNVACRGWFPQREKDRQA